MCLDNSSLAALIRNHGFVHHVDDADDNQGIKCMSVPDIVHWEFLLTLTLSSIELCFSSYACYQLQAYKHT